jgi:hypothetical protein
MFFWLEASGYQLEAFSHTTATYLMAMCCAEMHPFQTRSSPLEAAEAGTQTVGHSPQSCRPFRVSPPMPLSVLPNELPEPALTVDPTMARRLTGITGRSIGEKTVTVNKNLTQIGREIVHLEPVWQRPSRPRSGRFCRPERRRLARSCSQQARFWRAGTQCSGAGTKKFPR